MASTTPQVCTCPCSSGDSSLSVTSNIVSLLTFAYLIIVGGLYQFASYQQANDGTLELLEKAAKLRTDAQQFKNKYSDTDNDRVAERVDIKAERVEKELSSFIAKVEKQSRNKWYMIWREITFKTSRERAGWANKLELCQQLVNLELCSLKLLEQVQQFNELRVSYQRSIRRWQLQNDGLTDSVSSASDSETEQHAVHTRTDFIPEPPAAGSNPANAFEDDVPHSRKSSHEGLTIADEAIKQLETLSQSTSTHELEEVVVDSQTSKNQP